jgi:peptidoglycan/LPS O-acetylase OafA/YrhL
MAWAASPFTDPNQKRSAHGDSLRALDGVRGLAVTIVIASHAGAFGMAGQGGLGILLFFMLSGFVLMLPFADRPERIFQRDVLLRFVTNRALRIVPVFLVAVLLIRWLIGQTSEWALDNASFHAGWDHLWSVAEEVRFYLLFPIVIAALATLSKGLPRMSLLAALIFIGWILRTSYLVSMTGGRVVEFYFWTFLAGMLVCLLHGQLSRNGSMSNQNAQIFFESAAVAIVALMFAASEETGNFLLRHLFPGPRGSFAFNQWDHAEFWCVLFAVLLLSITVFQRSYVSRLMQSWPMRHLGLLSYSLYLFHVPIMIIVEPYGLQQSNLFIVTFAATYVAALVAYVAVEKPFLMLKPKDSQKQTLPRDCSTA